MWEGFPNNLKAIPFLYLPTFLNTATNTFHGLEDRHVLTMECSHFEDDLKANNLG
jgi:hypothetical protein